MADLNNGADKAATNAKMANLKKQGLLLTQSLEAGACTLARFAYGEIQSGLGYYVDKVKIDKDYPNTQRHLDVDGYRNVLREAGKSLVKVLDNQNLADAAQKCGLDVSGMGSTRIMLEHTLSPNITF